MLIECGYPIQSMAASSKSWSLVCYSVKRDGDIRVLWNAQDAGRASKITIQPY